MQFGLRYLYRSAVGVLLAAVGACSPTPEADPLANSIQWDSAGVTITETGERDAGRRLFWTVELDLQIGQALDDGPESFSRISGVRQLADGRISVLDAGANELRVFDGGGRFVGRGGRQGSGPGEFQNPVLVSTLPGDSLLIFDVNLRRFTIYAGDGAGYREIARDVLPGPLTAGVAVAAVGQRAFFRTGVYPEHLSHVQGQFSYPLHLRWVSLDGANADTLITTDLQVYRAQINGMSTLLEVPYAGRPSAAAGTASFFASDGHQIFRYDSTAVLNGILRITGGRASDPRLLEAVVEGLVARSGPSTEADLRRAYSEMTFPDPMPMIESLVVDGVDWLWAKRHQIAEAVEHSWWVFDPTGRLIGSVESPASLAVHQIGQDFMIGVWQDDLGLEYVRRYALSRTN